VKIIKGQGPEAQNWLEHAFQFELKPRSFDPYVVVVAQKLMVLVPQGNCIAEIWRAVL